jgi:hypothetical protein
MSFDVMGARHRFGFYAGVVPIALNEPFDSVSKRVSECVGLAMEKGGPQWVYWVETDIPERLDAFQKKIVEEAKKIFARHHVEESTLIPSR